MKKRYFIGKRHLVIGFGVRCESFKPERVIQLRRLRVNQAVHGLAGQQLENFQPIK